MARRLFGNSNQARRRADAHSLWLQVKYWIQSSDAVAQGTEAIPAKHIFYFKSHRAGPGGTDSDWLAAWPWRRHILNFTVSGRLAVLTRTGWPPGPEALPPHFKFHCVGPGGSDSDWLVGASRPTAVAHCCPGLALVALT